MNEICIINYNLLFVIVFMHEICRINMHVLHFTVLRRREQEVFLRYFAFFAKESTYKKCLREE